MIHLIIIWPKAMSYKDKIIEDVSCQFDVKKIFKFHWDRKSYYKNLKIFYSHSLKDFSDRRYNRIISSKIKNVGIGDFIVVVFEDVNPCIEKRETTSGVVEVNSHVFDLKTKYRSIIGGSRIHSSNDNWETNKDLTLLFGLNTEDFLERYSGSSLLIEDVQRNCMGYDGYSSIEEFFYVLNNCLKYVVLRNHENLPDKYVSTEHGDIDLLVEHFNYAVKLTNAERAYRQDYRVYHYIKIAGNQYPFDFRYIGDQYYDPNWEQSIIDNRILLKNVFYAPCCTDQFYSLLYHAYIQKREVKEDYFQKLDYYAKCIGTEYDNKEFMTSLGLLFPYLKSNSYDFIRPIDKSVYYNKKNILISKAFDYLKNNTSIKEVVPIHLKHSFYSGYVYFKGILDSRNVFIKYGGSGESCKKEFVFTKRAHSLDSRHFVNAISLCNDGVNDYAVYEYVDGRSLDSSSIIQKEDLSNQLKKIYEVLQEAQILHRDVKPDNFLIVNGNLVLIDFQYAIDINEWKEYSYLINNATQIISLGDKCRYRWYAWNDFYSFKETARLLGASFNSERKGKVFTMSLKILATRRFWIWLIKKIKGKLLNSPQSFEF